jgi:ABC-type uncharacterized transport system permease subunit
VIRPVQPSAFPVFGRYNQRMENVHVFCFFASYVVALALDGLRLLRGSTLLRALALGFGLAGLLAQSIYLVARSNATDLPPLLSSAHDWLLVLAWTAVVFYLFLSLVLWVIKHDVPMGLFILPVVLILIGASDLVGSATNPALSGATDAAARDAQQAALRNWGMLHASFLVFGIAGVIVGFVFSLMYVVQHRRLKHRKPAQSGLSLPSLATLARLNWWSVIVSIPLLTLGLLTGVRLVFLSRDTAGPISFGDPLVVGSAVVGVVMIAFFLWLVRAEHLGGRQIALRTLYAFGFLLVTLIGLQVLTGGHRSTRTSAQQPGARRILSSALTESFRG